MRLLVSAALGASAAAYYYYTEVYTAEEADLGFCEENPDNFECATAVCQAGSGGFNWVDNLYPVINEFNVNNATEGEVVEALNDLFVSNTCASACDSAGGVIAYDGTCIMSCDFLTQPTIMVTGEEGLEELEDIADAETVYWSHTDKPSGSTLDVTYCLLD